MKLLVVNVLFDPLSFGGATIVAEHMADELAARHGFDVTAVSARTGFLPAGSVVRHQTRSGLEAFNIGLPYAEHFEQRYDNPRFTAHFRDVLNYVDPDVVHVHCAQDIGTGFFDLLVERDIPFAVTIHDFWWACERQFMITVDGQACEQHTVDPAVCVRCGVALGPLTARRNLLAIRLALADRVLAPSRFMAGFARDNGAPFDRLVVAPNGVRAPALPPPARGDGPTVFGFVGGPGANKGWDLIRRAFPAAGTANARLVATDAGSRLGQPWHERLAREAPGIDLTVVPPYDQSSLDDFFAGIDVLLMPSIFREPFGLTAREALLRDVWVIAADAGALAEDIVNGENGTVLPYPPTAETLAAAIRARIGRPKRPLPHKDRIVTIARQGAELAGLLRTIVEEHRMRGR